MNPQMYSEQSRLPLQNPYSRLADFADRDAERLPFADEPSDTANANASDTGLPRSSSCMLRLLARSHC